MLSQQWIYCDGIYDGLELSMFKTQDELVNGSVSGGIDGLI